MINLRQAIYYEFVDDTTVEIFDKYKWGLRRLGINFSQELLETIVYCPQNLESTLRAFCAWVLWLQNQGEKLDKEMLAETLINVLKSEQGWVPFDSQEEFLKQHSDILDSPQELIWREAGNILGYELRNKLISDISENGKIMFRRNLHLNDEEYHQIEVLKSAIADLFF